MQIQTYDAACCPMTRIMGMIGGKWKPVMLYLIAHNVNRFGLLRRRMPKVSRKVLTEQLRELENDGLISRTVVTAKAPQVVVYHVTEKGASLRKLLDDLLTWGQVYLQDMYDHELLREHLANVTAPAAVGRRKVTV